MPVGFADGFYLCYNNSMIGRNKLSVKNILFNQRSLAIFGLIIIVVIGFPLVRSANQRYRINKEISDLENEVKTVTNKNNELSHVLDYIDSDQFAEEQARLNFGLKKNNEEVAIIKDANNTSTEATTSLGEGIKTIYNIPMAPDSAKKLATNPSKWWKYFFNKKQI